MKFKNKKNGIVITSFNRLLLLKKCLKSLQQNPNFNDYLVVLVQQNYTKEVKKIVNELCIKNIHIIKTKYSKISNPYSKMTLNGFQGFSYCFDKLKMNKVFYLEDDIKVSYDFLKFGNYILDKYRNDNSFFAFNGFSSESFDKKKISIYSKFTYGIGKGWGINKNNWTYIKLMWNKSFIYSDKPMYDNPIEKYIKENGKFVVMPLCSRTLEMKSNGVSVNYFKNKDYFIKMRKSFTSIKYNGKYNYKIFVQFNWRKDCITYFGYSNYLIYLIMLKIKNIFI